MIRLISTGFYENLKMAIATLKSNKLRSFLTIVGIIVGVITVMLISSIISGIDTAFTKEIESFGTNSIFIYKFDIGIRTSAPTREERMRPDLTVEDNEAIKTLSAVDTAVPFLDVSSSGFGQKTIVAGKNGKQTASVQISGTNPEMERTKSEILLEGRWFTEYENQNNKNVCLIGDTVKETFFEFESPIGKTLEINGIEFQVIGLLQKKEQLFGGGGGNNDQSNSIYMPMGAAKRIKPNSEDIFILAVAKEGMMVKAKDQIEDLLRLRRKVGLNDKRNFDMQTADSLIDQFRSILAGTALAMVVISSIGLLIGGIGVMNIMLVSVTERTREIGIRKAIGAKQSDILLQFLIEAATLTGLGGLLGLLIGWTLTFLVRLVFPSYVPLWAPVIGFVASVAIGIIFGLFPAWKAARLDPIESLRYE